MNWKKKKDVWSSELKNELKEKKEKDVWSKELKNELKEKNQKRCVK